ncbi:PQQ-binding-like beta-propeller repeat protein [Streptomyces sp. cg35]|uniref:PQQ-binding-like beta-propeller repeat protein n=1 Tax=Streptomyces sp. cg35 TaxID=3421650 RepID=UPI003D164A2A
MPAADEEAVYLLAESSRLRSVGRSDGKVRWTVRAPAEFRGQKVMETATAGRGRLLTPTTDGRVLVLDTRNGESAPGGTT